MPSLKFREEEREREEEKKKERSLNRALTWSILQLLYPALLGRMMEEVDNNPSGGVGEATERRVLAQREHKGIEI